MSASMPTHVQTSPHPISFFFSTLTFFALAPTNDQISSHCQSADFKISHVAIVVRGTSTSEVGQQLDNRILCNSGQANGGSDRAAFDQAINHSGAGFRV